MSRKKPLSRNLKIGTRITISSILGIVIPVIFAIIFTYVALNSITSYLNFSSVTTNSYSMLNQIQWSQTMSSVSNELVSSDKKEVKYANIKDIAAPLEKLETKIYIECNSEEFYATTDKISVLNEANSVTRINENENAYYFSNNGMVIVNHAENESERYTILVVNKNYSVKNISTRNTAQNFSSLVFGKTGILFLIIILFFILSTAAVSFITSKTIVKPIKKLAEGANEIANGNLEYKIDYESTNELGQTVDAFNDMSARLKESIEDRNAIEQSRKEMIAGVAHDLRTPLTSVKGYVEGIRDGIANTPEKQEKYLETIYDSTLSMERLLDELLTISRLELGNITLYKESTEVVDFVNRCADEIAPVLEKEGFDFEVNNNCKNGEIIEIDEDRFSRVIQNIVSNSIKYSRKNVKGKIVFETQSYEKSVIFSISDNGIGVESENLSKIFDTFYRADKSRSRVREGSGIGLAVCRQIVELHGGHIWATKNDENGLTILISLKKAGSKNE